MNNFDDGYVIIISPEAEQDLIEIYTYIASKNGEEQGIKVLNRLEVAVYSLEKLPMRGNIPPELITLGISRYREIHVNPWRIIYEIVPNNIVHIHWIFDSRRAIADQLTKKILR